MPHAVPDILYNTVQTHDSISCHFSDYIHRYNHRCSAQYSSFPVSQLEVLVPLWVEAFLYHWCLKDSVYHSLLLPVGQVLKSFLHFSLVHKSHTAVEATGAWEGRGGVVHVCRVCVHVLYTCNYMCNNINLCALSVVP